MGELIFLGILLIICIYFYSLTFGFAVSVLDKSGGAAVFPRIVIIFLAIFLIARMIAILVQKKKAHFYFKELFQGMRLFFFASVVAYILLMKPLGYIASTILFLVVTANCFYYKARDTWGSVRSIIMRNVLVVAFALLMNYFFVRILHIMLPSGTWLKLF